MKVCVISGSPKGKNSITLQSIHYLEKKFPSEEFNIIHVGAQIKSMEKHPEDALEAVKAADMLMFCYPVFTFMAPCQMHRFIDILKDSDVDLSDKWACQYSTSMHFFDVQAHEYVRLNCLDMGMKYLGGLSHEMEDLTREAGQRELVEFWKTLRFKMENGIFDISQRGSNSANDCTGNICDVSRVFDEPVETAEKRPGHELAIVADLEEGDEELAGLIDRFKEFYPHKVDVFDLRKIRMDGGCISCMHCAAKGNCIYKDGFTELLRDQIQTHKAVVYAFRVSNHCMGYRMKMFDDRQFCNGHRSLTEGTPMAYIAAGDLENEANLQAVMKARAQMGGNYLAGTATDAESVRHTAAMLAYAAENDLKAQNEFYRVGGMKIFRDLIWTMGGLMKADYRFFKQQGYLDFPQKNRKKRLMMRLVGIMYRPKIRSKMGSRMIDGMLAPYNKVIDAATPEE